MGFNDEQYLTTIQASSKVGEKYRSIFQGEFDGYSTVIENTPSLSELGKELLTEDEFYHITNKDIDLDNWLKNLPKNQQEINVEFLSEQEKTA